MALWNFKSKDKFEDVESVILPASNNDANNVAVVASPTNHPKSTIAAGVVVSGAISAPGDVQIEGRVIGDVRCATVIVGKDGDVKGNVTAETATIRGRVVGNVRARIIQLAATGSVEGDLSHAVLIIEEGGVFDGRSKRVADPLNELALAAPEAAMTDEPVARAASKSTKAKAKPKAAPKAEPEVAEAPGSRLDEAPRSSLADVLGEKFAVAS